jgi:Ca2+-binding EF-hand superfamily protein
MKIQAVLICTAALLSPAAMAGDDPANKDKGDTFTSLDTDADGKLSQEEVATHSGLSASFAKLDGDSDGYISKREFRRNTMRKPKD